MKIKSLNEIEISIDSFCETLEKDKSKLLWKTYNLKTKLQREEVAKYVLDTLKKDFLKVYADARKEKWDMRHMEIIW